MGCEYIRGRSPQGHEPRRYQRRSTSLGAAKLLSRRRAIPWRARIAPSIKLQFRDACVDEARGQFIIRSISALCGILFCGSRLASGVTAGGRLDTMWAKWHVQCSFRDLTVTGTEVGGPLGSKNTVVARLALLRATRLDAWVAVDARGLHAGVAVLDLNPTIALGGMAIGPGPCLFFFFF